MGLKREGMMVLWIKTMFSLVIHPFKYFKSLLGSGMQRWLKPHKMVRSLLSGLQERKEKREIERHRITERQKVEANRKSETE